MTADITDTPESPGIGTEGQQLARLIHAEEVHGLTPHDCPACTEEGEACSVCDGVGAILTAPGGVESLRPCGPACPLHEVRPV